MRKEFWVIKLWKFFNTNRGISKHTHKTRKYDFPFCYIIYILAKIDFLRFCKNSKLKLEQKLTNVSMQFLWNSYYCTGSNQSPHSGKLHLQDVLKIKDHCYPYCGDLIIQERWKEFREQ